MYIYAKYIHNSICIYVHIGTTVHMYMQPPHNCPLGASKKCCSCAKTYNSVFDYPGEMGERSKLMPKQLKPSRGFIHRAISAQPLNAPSSFAGIKNSSKAVGCSSTNCNCFQTHECEKTATISAAISGLARGHPTQNTSLGTLGAQGIGISKARPGLSFYKTRVCS